jgi:hypothetical protein
MIEVLIPNTKIETTKPIIFLAGPIQGTSNWRQSAIETISSLSESLLIVSPSGRLTFNQDYIKIIPSQNDFKHQREWENCYLDQASHRGSILFWFPGETEHSCQKSYGAMTRVEIGEWITEYKYNPSINLIIGTDGKFSEFKTIRRDIDQKMPETIIYETLEETCRAAVNIIQK